MVLVLATSLPLSSGMVLKPPISIGFVIFNSAEEMSSGPNGSLTAVRM